MRTIITIIGCVGKHHQDYTIIKEIWWGVQAPFTISFFLSKIYLKNVFVTYLMKARCLYMAAVIDDKTPLTFDTPDGDTIILPPWDYIVDKISYLLEPTIEKMHNINQSLTVIDNRLDDWIPEDAEI
jgi:hypothetical protein